MRSQKEDNPHSTPEFQEGASGDFENPFQIPESLCQSKFLPGENEPNPCSEILVGRESKLLKKFLGTYEQSKMKMVQNFEEPKNDQFQAFINRKMRDMKYLITDEEEEKEYSQLGNYQTFSLEDLFSKLPNIMEINPEDELFYKLLSYKLRTEELPEAQKLEILSRLPINSNLSKIFLNGTLKVFKKGRTKEVKTMKVNFNVSYFFNCLIGIMNSKEVARNFLVNPASTNFLISLFDYLLIGDNYLIKKKIVALVTLCMEYNDAFLVSNLDAFVRRIFFEMRFSSSVVRKLTEIMVSKFTEYSSQLNDLENEQEIKEKLKVLNVLANQRVFRAKFNTEEFSAAYFRFTFDFKFSEEIKTQVQNLHKKLFPQRSCFGDL